MTTALCRIRANAESLHNGGLKFVQKRRETKNITQQILPKSVFLRCTHKSRVSNLVFPLPVELVRS